MTKLQKVIFDTNRLYNKKWTTFLANSITWLDKFSKVAEIILPDMVIWELKYKYIRDFENEKQKFVKTILSSFLSHDAGELDINERVKKLYDDEPINFKVIELKDFSILEDIKKLSLRKEAPFDSGDGTDKWFKDSYIYFTILEYLKNSDDEYIYVCTSDWRLKEALNKHPNIKIIKDFDDFEEQTTWYFKKDYFIGKLNEILPQEVENIWDIIYNYSNDWLITVQTKDMDNYMVIVDFSTKDVLDFCRRWEYDNLIEQLVSSNSFWDTHKYSKKILKYLSYLIDDDLKKLFYALMSNDQIFRAYHHSVAELYEKLYHNKGYLLTDDEQKKIENIINF